MSRVSIMLAATLTLAAAVATAAAPESAREPDESQMRQAMQAYLEARSAGVAEVIGTTRSSNEAMKQLARRLGFVLGPEPDDASLTRLTCLL